MSASKNGIAAGGRVVVQHQTEETMAALLLARKGEVSLIYNEKQ